MPRILSHNTLQRAEKTSEVVDQRSNKYALQGTIITINVTDGAKCISLIDNGKRVYRFVGDADDAEDTLLANEESAASAAKSLRTCIYTMACTPLKVNTYSLSQPYKPGDNKTGR